MRKSKLTTWGLILAILTGLALVSYPTLSNAWNYRHVSRLKASYTESVAGLKEDDYSSMWLEAQDYNRRIRELNSQFIRTEELDEEYESLLDVSGTGIMGYVEIPRLNITLPIYHGTSDGVLQIATGHLEWSSLPVGGAGTHSVISGHRGLPSAQLFTNLPDLEIGDVFYLRVLNEVLTYEVDQIVTVLPDDFSELRIESGKDYCTLVTCTPYAINTHRLLVRGHRIESEEQQIRQLLVTAEAARIEPLIVAPVIMAPMLLLMLLIVSATDGKKRKDRKGRWEKE